MPVRDRLTSPVDAGAHPERVDAGKDYGNVKRFQAVGAGVISQVYQGLSGFGTTIIEKLTTPAAGPGGTPEDYIYYAAENSGLSPTIQGGQSVQQGQELASGPGGSGGVEVGFWDPSTGRAAGHYTEGGPPTPEGQAFVADISGRAPIIRPGGAGSDTPQSDVSKMLSAYQEEVAMPRTAPKNGFAPLEQAGWKAPFKWWLQSFTSKWAADQGAGSQSGGSGVGGGAGQGGTVQAAKQDVGAGSSFLPVMGIYPATRQALGLSGGEFKVIISRADGGHLRPVRGTPLGNGEWRVVASAEDDPPGAPGSCGPIKASGYSELSTVPMGNASDFAGLGRLPCGTVLNIRKA